MFVKTLLIIPAYNEEESLKRTIDAVRAEAPSVDFLVVNDGSQDGTERVCRENQYPFLDLATNLGLAGAFQTGLKYAYRHDYDCAIQFDAPRSHAFRTTRGQHRAHPTPRAGHKDLRYCNWITFSRQKKTAFFAHVRQ